MRTYARVIAMGNSLGIIMTKELKKMGIQSGDWVYVEVIEADDQFKNVSKAKEMTEEFDKRFRPVYSSDDLKHIRVQTEREEPQKKTKKEYPDNYAGEAFAPIKATVKQPTNTVPEPYQVGTNTTFDPSVIGKQIIKTTTGVTYEDDEYRMLIQTYDGDKDHIETILEYIKENKK